MVWVVKIGLGVSFLKFDLFFRLNFSNLLLLFIKNNEFLSSVKE